MLPVSRSRSIFLLMANSVVQWLGWADGVVFVYDCHSAYSFDMIPRYRDGAVSRRALCVSFIHFRSTLTRHPLPTAKRWPR